MTPGSPAKPLIPEILQKAIVGGYPHRSQRPGAKGKITSELVRKIFSGEGLHMRLATSASWILAASLAALSPQARAITGTSGKTCDVRAYGAKGDGVTKDTAAIQSAIDACTANKAGGTVKLSGGTFVSGPIHLKSNITLDVEKGATLLGSPDRADFPAGTFAHLPTVQPLVGSLNAENIVVTGGGTIDGNGQLWWDYVKGVRNSGVLGTDHPRPMGMVFDH